MHADNGSRFFTSPEEGVPISSVNGGESERVWILRERNREAALLGTSVDFADREVHIP